MISFTQLPTITNVEQSWNQTKDTIRKAASAVVGVTKPGVYQARYFGMTSVKRRKKKKRKFLDGNTLANWQIYKNANRKAKKATAGNRTVQNKNLYDKLYTLGGERDLYRLVKSRHERTRDIEHFYCVNDKNGTLLTNHQVATDRW